MSVYHLTVRVHGRSTGKRHGESISVVARAAYRSGETLVDNRIGQSFDYSKKSVRESFILAPAGSPSWVLDRAQLWNKVEATETRKDSQLAREIEVSLPRELSDAQQKILICDFLKPLIDEGMIIDVGIHEPDDLGGNPQPHAHCLLTMRRLQSDGSGFGKKETAWNPEFAGRGRVQDKGPLMGLREKWAELCNQNLAAAGSKERISSKRRIDQLIDALSDENYPLALKLSESPPQSKRYRRLTPNQADRQASDIKNWRVLHESIGDLQCLVEHGRVEEAARAKADMVRFAETQLRRSQKPAAAPTPAAPNAASPTPQPAAIMAAQEIVMSTVKPKSATPKLRTHAKSPGIDFHALSNTARFSAEDRFRKKKQAAQEQEAAEELDERQKFKRRLLEKLYSDDVARLLASKALFVNLKDPDSISIKLIGGGEVFDQGDRILCGGDPKNLNAEVAALVEIAKSKRAEAGASTETGGGNWQQVQVYGDDQFVFAAAKALAAAGFTVSARDESQDAIVKKAIAEVLTGGESTAVPKLTRVIRAEQEEADRVIANAADRYPRDDAFRRLALFRLGDEADTTVLHRITEHVRKWLKSDPAAPMMEPQFQNAVTRISDQIWMRILNGEIQLNLLPTPLTEAEQHSSPADDGPTLG